jgi:hypothetical protein
MLLTCKGRNYRLTNPSADKCTPPLVDRYGLVRRAQCVRREITTVDAIPFLRIAQGDAFLSSRCSQ